MEATVAARKPWSYSVGPRGARVRAAERAKAGDAVYLFVRHPGRQREEKKSLKLRLRDAKGRLVKDAVDEAKREAAALSNRLLSGSREAQADAPVTLGEVITRFRRDVLPRQGARTREESEREIKLLTAYLGEDFAVEQLDPATWYRLDRDRASGRIDGAGQIAKQPQPVGPRTRAKSLKFLRQLVRFAMEARLPGGQYLLAMDPTRGLDVPRERDPKRPLMDEGRYDKLLAAVDAAQKTARAARRQAEVKGRKRGVRRAQRVVDRCDLERALYVLARHTGRRVSSILGLEWADWKPNESLYGVIRWRAAADKLGRSWTVPVTAPVREVLEGLQRTGPRVFPHPRGPQRSVSRAMASNWLKASEARAGLGHVAGGGWHTFRRLWATERKGLSLKDVAYAGGWKDTTTLLNIYQQPDIESLQQVVQGGQRNIKAV